MDFLNIFNFFFLNYNYNTILLQLNNTSSIENYLPLVSFFNIIFFLKTLTIHLLTSIELILQLQLSTNMKDAICMAIKFLICIALLIFARGGIPRFRFDYLTKLGWIRFLSLVLMSFLVELLILSMF